MTKNSTSALSDADSKQFVDLGNTMAHVLVTRSIMQLLAVAISRDPDELLTRIAQDVAPSIDRLTFPSPDDGAVMRTAAHRMLAKITEPFEGKATT